jgi:methanogenic corrinoid protein MtbC1
LADAYAAAVIAGDEVAAEITVREAMDSGLSSAEIDETMIAPALWLIGKLWERGQVSVGQEHLATEISERVLALQREAQRVAESRPDRRVLLATPTGESHVVALRMVANLLREAGYGVVMLGAGVPTPDVGAAARRHGAGVICLSLTMPGRTTHVLAEIDEILREWPSAGFVIGGRGLTTEAQLRPQVRVCPRVSDAVEAVDSSVKRAALN